MDKQKHIEAAKFIRTRRIQQIRREIQEILQKNDLSVLEVIAVLEDLKISVVADIVTDAMIRYAMANQKSL